MWQQPEEEESPQQQFSIVEKQQKQFSIVVTQSIQTIYLEIKTHSWVVRT